MLNLKKEARATKLEELSSQLRIVQRTLENGRKLLGRAANQIELMSAQFDFANKEAQELLKEIDIYLETKELGGR